MHFTNAFKKDTGIITKEWRTCTNFFSGGGVGRVGRGPGLIDKKAMTMFFNLFSQMGLIGYFKGFPGLNIFRGSNFFLLEREWDGEEPNSLSL